MQHDSVWYGKVDRELLRIGQETLDRGGTAYFRGNKAQDKEVMRNSGVVSRAYNRSGARRSCKDSCSRSSEVERPYKISPASGLIG